MFTDFYVIYFLQFLKVYENVIFIYLFNYKKKKTSFTSSFFKHNTLTYLGVEYSLWTSQRWIGRVIMADFLYA